MRLQVELGMMCSLFDTLKKINGGIEAAMWGEVG